jgi:PIN domain nuclease of toxin-antitoxin system
MIYLDTHAVAWLYAGKVKLLPENIRLEIAREELLISPMVLLELQYLYEIGRVAEKGSVVVQDLSKRIGLSVCTLPFETVIERAVEQTWTRDPFDRIIVAQASIHSTRLVTKDTMIHENYSHALWKKP